MGDILYTDDSKTEAETGQRQIDRITGREMWEKRLLQEGTKEMNTFDYVVVSIDGDYANLRRTDIESDELKLVARALLPDTIVEGTKLHYEYMEYTIVD